jgi:hypothetical protein
MSNTENTNIFLTANISGEGKRYFLFPSNILSPEEKGFILQGNGKKFSDTDNTNDFEQYLIAAIHPNPEDDIEYYEEAFPEFVKYLGKLSEYSAEKGEQKNAGFSCKFTLVPRY